MEQYIVEVKLLLDELQLDYYSRILMNDNKLNGKHITGQFIINLYKLTNKIFNRNNQPSSCASCIINNLNDLIDYLILNDRSIVETTITPINEEKPLKKKK